MNITTSTNKKPSAILKIGLIANILEWYEFCIYAHLITVMGQLYAPSEQSITELINAWGAFSLSYVARPIGSFFWGYIGDKQGYSYSLKASLLTMAIPTIFIGLLPTYQTIGNMAILILLCLRFIQGFAAGGELPVSACYVFETAPSRLRSLLCGTVAIGSGIGILLGSFVTSVLYWSIDMKTILAGAWRIPYLLSIPMSIWIFYVRHSIIQPTSLAPSPQRKPFSISDQLLTLKQLLNAGLISSIALVGFMEVCFYTTFFYFPSYLTHFFNVPQPVAQSLNTLALSIQIPFLLLAGYLSSIITYKRLLILHTIGIVLLTYPLFYSLQTASFLELLGIQISLAYLVSGLGGVMMEALGHTYADKIRCSGMSVTHTVAATLFGGTTPLLCTLLINKTGIIFIPAFYIIAFGCVALPIFMNLRSVQANKIL